ncbi:MAG: hypothetical protein ACK5NG_02435 [Chthoniobacterales bacterium]
MNASVSPVRRSLLSFTNTFEPKPITIIYIFGVIVWAAMTFILGYKPDETQVSYAVFEAFGSAWQKAFLWSLAAVAVASAFYCVIRKKNIMMVLIASLIYVSPFALFLLGVWTMDAIYYRHFATVETTRLFGPIFMLFYLIGIIYMTWRIPKGREEALPAFMLPTMTVTLLILGLTAFRLFTSTDYIYWNAFNIMVNEINRQDDTTQVQGVLTINKAGEYSFLVVGGEIDLTYDDQAATPTIAWVEGNVTPSTTGDHSFEIVIPKNKLQEQQARVTDPALAAEPYTDIPPYNPEAYLQVSIVGEDGKPNTFIKSLPIWTEEY